METQLDIEKNAYNKVLVTEKEKIKNLAQVAKIMSDKLNDLGFKVPVKEKDLVQNANGDGTMSNIKTIKIDPKDAGLLAPIYKSIEVEISVGFSSRIGVGQVTLQYHWQHPSGSNGYRITYVLRDGEWEVLN